MKQKIHIPLKGEIVEGIALIDWRWFCTFGCYVGIVLGKDEKTDLYHGYMGNCSILGGTEYKDISSIISLGAHLSKDETMGFFPDKRVLKDIQKEEKWKK